MSAIRPAKTDTTAPGLSTRASATVRTWSRVRMAVTLRCSPSADRSLTSAAELSPRVFVTGILTKTLGPHEPMSRACVPISSNSSENTSKEMGLSVMLSRTFRANPG